MMSNDEHFIVDVYSINVYFMILEEITMQELIHSHGSAEFLRVSVK